MFKHALIAHEKGTDNYVVAAVGGGLSACGQGVVDVYRREESLVPFEEVSRQVMADQIQLEKDGIIAPGSARDRFVRDMTDLLRRAIMYLGWPPKEKVEFFSLPDGIVDNLHWTPRR